MKKSWVSLPFIQFFKENQEIYQISHSIKLKFRSKIPWFYMKRPADKTNLYFCQHASILRLKVKSCGIFLSCSYVLFSRDFRYLGRVSSRLLMIRTCARSRNLRLPERETEGCTICATLNPLHLHPHLPKRVWIKKPTISGLFTEAQPPCHRQLT